jgi:hypothetical protein
VPPTATGHRHRKLGSGSTMMTNALRVTAVSVKARARLGEGAGIPR